MQLINAINISYASSHFSDSSLAIIGLYILRASIKRSLFDGFAFNSAVQRD